MASKYKVLVVGSNGFIGKNIVEYLEKQNYNVYVQKEMIWICLILKKYLISFKATCLILLFIAPA